MHRYGRLFASCVGTIALVGAVGAAPAAAAPRGTPPETGCPAGQLLSVAFLEAQGPYALPRQLDQAGNRDGFVCGRPLPPAATEQQCSLDPCLVPVIYLFRENDVRAAR